MRTSDWVAAHLTAEQLEYAAGDVLYLPELLDVLEGRLGRLDLPNCTTIAVRSYPLGLRWNWEDTQTYLPTDWVGGQRFPPFTCEEAEPACGNRSQPGEQPQVPRRVRPIDMLSGHC